MHVDYHSDLEQRQNKIEESAHTPTFDHCGDTLDPTTGC